MSQVEAHDPVVSVTGSFRAWVVDEWRARPFLMISLVVAIVCMMMGFFLWGVEGKNERKTISGVEAARLATAESHRGGFHTFEVKELIWIGPEEGNDKYVSFYGVKAEYIHVKNVTSSKTFSLSGDVDRLEIVNCRFHWIDLSKAHIKALQIVDIETHNLDIGGTVVTEARLTNVKTRRLNLAFGAPLPRWIEAYESELPRLRLAAPLVPLVGIPDPKPQPEENPTP